VNLKAITFISPSESYYFYESFHDSDYGQIFGMKELTLPKAISVLKAKRIDTVQNFKMNIQVYMA